MNWINDFWNVMWPVFAGAGSLMLAFAIMFAFIVMPVVLLRVAWAALNASPDLLRLRRAERLTTEAWERAGLESLERSRRFQERESAGAAQAVEAAGVDQEVEGDDSDAAPEGDEAEATTGEDTASAPAEDNPPPEIVTAETQAAEEEAARVAQEEREAEAVKDRTSAVTGRAFTVDDPNEPYQSIMKRLKEWRGQGKAR